MTRYRKTILTLSLIWLLQGCYYDVAEELYPSSACETQNMSYQNDILPILQNSGCIGCHGDNSSIDINSYEDLKVYVDNDALLGSIKHSDGYRPMPDFQPKIDQCLIDKIEAWIYDGAPNN